jgi:hypothetical protein
MYASENESYFEHNILKNFVLRVCITQIGSSLQKTMTSNNIDREKINADVEKE